MHLSLLTKHYTVSLWLACCTFYSFFYIFFTSIKFWCNEIKYPIILLVQVGISTATTNRHLSFGILTHSCDRNSDTSLLISKSTHLGWYFFLSHLPLPAPPFLLPPPESLRPWHIMGVQQAGKKGRNHTGDKKKEWHFLCKFSKGRCSDGLCK